ncbi:MAG TPA: hypothetical protein VET26_00140 [Candidatus Sulfotelmatobacter sp.]|nr:hypothetical protein [Candidatus Sulfotelmatobacter sp.]
MAMDLFSMERWMLDRHDERVANAERRVRLSRPAAGWRFDAWAAVRLRRLADRLDGGFPAETELETEPAGAGISATGS